MAAAKPKYLVASSHAEDTAAGGSFGPGEIATGVDPSDPHDKQKIDAGVFVELSAPRKSADRKETK